MRRSGTKTQVETAEHEGFEGLGETRRHALVPHLLMGNSLSGRDVGNGVTYQADVLGYDRQSTEPK